MDVSTGDARETLEARTVAPERVEMGALLLAAVTTAIMLQATRVFLSYMVFIIDQSERVQLGLMAGGVYLGIALGAIVPRAGGKRRAVLVVTSGMVAARLVMQFWTLPEGRMWLGATTIVLAGWLLPLLLTVARPAAAFGVGLGLALDLAFRVGRDSLDLPFIPTWPAQTITVMLGLLAVLGAVMLGRVGASARPTGLATSAMALGPALALHHLVTGNLGTAQVRIGVTIDSGAWLLALGMVVGLALDVVVVGRTADSRMSSMTVSGTITAVGAVGILLFWQDSAGLGALGLVMGTAATMALLVGGLRGGNGSGGVAATALWMTLGLVVHAILLFAYFTATGWPMLITVLYAVVALGALLGSWRPALHRPPWPVTVGGLGGVSAVMAVALVLTTVGSGTRVAGAALPAEFTVMTYNIQSGFSVDNEWDLDRTAAVIEAADPDVVILQEVGRGWPILSAVDQAEWLSQRLGMQLVWGPASRDDLWGNAILTTAPIIATEWVKFDTTENLRRGAVRVVLETDAGPVLVIGTHLDNPGSATSARQEQISQLLDLWGGEEPAIIAGDLNADPDSEAIRSIIAAGFTDTGAGLGADAVTSDDGRRIDYVLTSPGLSVVSTEIPDTWASDHRPFVATVKIGP